MAEYRLPTIPEFKKAESAQSPDLSFESSIFDRATRHGSSLSRRRGLFGLGGFGRADPVVSDTVDLLGEEREFQLLAHRACKKSAHRVLLPFCLLDQRIQ